MQPEGPSGDAISQTYTRLTAHCRESLERSYDASRHLYSRQLWDGKWDEIDAHLPHETLTSSCIALIGHAADNASHDSVEPQSERCLEAILHEVPRTGYVGSIGLVLWAAAATGAGHSWQHILSEVGLSADLIVSEVATTLTTMELSWLVSGLAHQYRAMPSDECAALGRSCISRLIAERFNPTASLMRHASPRASFAHRARANIANFADQIYAVQALAFAHQMYDDAEAEALPTAQRLGQRLCDLQGPLGQWWWHYNAANGKVAQRFAVYSVHQHAMAPMALAELDRADPAAPRHDQFIARSLDWLDHNESGSSMIDDDARTIWRDLDVPRSRLQRVGQGVSELAGRADNGGDGPVALNRETRPYEWAWCLYAGALHG